MQNTSRNNLNNEISLKEIFLFLYNGRFAIFSITGVFAVASIVYTMMVVPVYEAKLTIKPINSINLSKINSRKHPELEAYGRPFIKNLVKELIYSNKLKINTLPSEFKAGTQRVVSDNYYVNSLKFEENKDEISLFIQADNPLFVAAYLNNFAHVLAQQALSELIIIEKNRVSVVLQNFIIEKEIEMSKVKSKDSKKLSELNMDILMSKALNKKKGFLSQLTKDSQFSGLGTLPGWYTLGQDALQKKLELLIKLQKNISSEKLAIIDFNIAQLKSFKVDFGDAQLISYTPSTVPTDPIYPHKKKIVIVTIIIAFFLSIFFVYMRQVFSKN